MPIKRKKCALFVDIVGGCNLRCPSCPVGNSSDKATPHGLMPPELLDRICAKAAKEFSRPTLYFFNWSEPFLHPRLADMIHIGKRHGFAVELSSNLNLTRNFEAVLSAEPRVLRVSMSGFEQGRYGITHKRGDIERVKANMARLAELKAKLRSKTRLTVLFHRYLGNHNEEANMRAYAEGLGYEFSAVWAFLMPVEKCVTLAQEGLTSDKLTQEDRDVIGRFALDPLEAIEIAKKHKNDACRLLEGSLALTHTGDVLLCCGTYDLKLHSVGNYLDLPIEALQQRREQHSYCGECAEQGVHVYAVYGAPEFDSAAIARIRSYYPEVTEDIFVKPRKTSLSRAMRHVRQWGRTARSLRLYSSRKPASPHL